MPISIWAKPRSKERVTIRASAVHGERVDLKPHLSLPLVCIGDAPQNCGLGGGGVLAMQDAVELADVLSRAGAFDQATGRVRLPPLREAEAVMLARKTAFNRRRKGDARLKPRDPHQPESRRMAEMVGSSIVPVPLEQLGAEARATLEAKGWRAGMPPEDAAALIQRWLREDLEAGHGRAGCDSTYPIYDNVRRYLEQEEEQTRLLGQQQRGANTARRRARL